MPFFFWIYSCGRVKDDTTIPEDLTLLFWKFWQDWQKTRTEMGKYRFKERKIQVLLYLSVRRVRYQPSPCTSCMEQSSCLPGCTHSYKFCNRSCVEHHHSKRNKPLFWTCQSTSCTCRSDLKTEQHWIYIHETRKVRDTSMCTVSRANTWYITYPDTQSNC